MRPKPGVLGLELAACTEGMELWAERREQDWFGKDPEASYGQHRGAREFKLTVDSSSPYRALMLNIRNDFPLVSPNRSMMAISCTKVPIILPAANHEVCPKKSFLVSPVAKKRAYVDH